jgi:hypothetical protein
MTGARLEVSDTELVTTANERWLHSVRFLIHFQAIEVPYFNMLNQTNSGD